MSVFAPISWAAGDGGVDASTATLIVGVVAAVLGAPFLNFLLQVARSRVTKESVIVTGASATVEAMNEAIEGLRRELNEVRSAGQAELARVRAEHAEQIAQLETRHRADMQRATERHIAEMAALREQIRHGGYSGGETS